MSSQFRPIRCCSGGRASANSGFEAGIAFNHEIGFGRNGIDFPRKSSDPRSSDCDAWVVGTGPCGPNPGECIHIPLWRAPLGAVSLLACLYLFGEVMPAGF